MKIAIAACHAALLWALPAFAHAQMPPDILKGLGTITNADLRKIPSGCSIVFYAPGKRMIAISTSPTETRVSFWFKPAGRLVESQGAAQKTRDAGFIANWSGQLSGASVKLSKGAARGNRNKPGEDGLFFVKGAIDWRGSKVALDWEAGC